MNYYDEYDEGTLDDFLDWLEESIKDEEEEDEYYESLYREIR